MCLRRTTPLYLSPSRPVRTAPQTASERSSYKKHVSLMTRLKLWLISRTLGVWMCLLSPPPPPQWRCVSSTTLTSSSWSEWSQRTRCGSSWSSVRSERYASGSLFGFTQAAVWHSICIHSGNHRLLILHPPPHVSVPLSLSLSTVAFVPSGEEVQSGPGLSHSVCPPAQHGSGLSGEQTLRTQVNSKQSPGD